MAQALASKYRSGDEGGIAGRYVNSEDGIKVGRNGDRKDELIISKIVLS